MLNGLSEDLSSCSFPWAVVSHLGLMTYRYSCENKNTIESQITGRKEAPLAAVWKSVVCRMYDVDHWQFVESRHQYVARVLFGG
jgi:hypothetical protein